MLLDIFPCFVFTAWSGVYLRFIHSVVALVTVWLLIQLAFMRFDHVNKISNSLLFWTWNLLEVSLDTLQ